MIKDYRIEVSGFAIRFAFIITYMLLTMPLEAQDPEDGWNFSYKGDKFSDNALLDLRYLNEDNAGDNGFIVRSEDGNSFVNGEGEPMRFWSINGGSLARDLSDMELKQYAQFLAKMGVNMIRFHGSINPKGKQSKITDVDVGEVESIWRLVAAMKNEGIYTTISPFWAHNGHMGGWIPEEWGIEGYSDKDNLWGVIFFNDTLKEAYKSWIKYLYTKINPHTGIALKDDPAVGMIQIMNEDGVFFWTIQNVKEPIKKIIRQKYYKWLVDKYGNIEKTQSAWEDLELEGDNPDDSEMDIYTIWYATIDQTGALDKRLTDQIEFMACIQREFYQEMYDFYRTIGCQQLINGNNWQTANSGKLLDIERWTNAACDVIALNRYYDPGHIGENSGWRIDPGHYYKGESVMYQPNKLPINIKQPSGHPIVITESGWNLPHKYQTEGPFLISAYMSLTGIDGFYWFDPSSEAYDPNPYHTWANLEGGQHPMYRWTNSTPGQIGMFPANALQYRKGYISESKTIIHEKRSLKSMWQRKTPVITENIGFDPNRVFIETESGKTEINPLTYLAGKVIVDYDAKDDSNSINDDLRNLIDSHNKRIMSSTGELEWDYDSGICILDAPSAQGVCGFLDNKETIILTDVSIESTNEYAAINVVSMDDQPLSKSSKILVQIGTIYRPSGWIETEIELELNENLFKGFRIDNTGGMPWKCSNTEVNIRINNSNISKAILLDEAGYAKESIAISKEDGSILISLPKNAMYVILD